MIHVYVAQKGHRRPAGSTSTEKASPPRGRHGKRTAAARQEAGARPAHAKSAPLWLDAARMGRNQARQSGNSVTRTGHGSEPPPSVFPRPSPSLPLPANGCAAEPCGSAEGTKKKPTGIAGGSSYAPVRLSYQRHLKGKVLKTQSGICIYCPPLTMKRF